MVMSAYIPNQRRLDALAVGCAAADLRFSITTVRQVNCHAI